MSSVNGLNDLGESKISKQKEKRDELKTKYHQFNSYCNALDRAEACGYSTYVVFKAANELTLKDCEPGKLEEYEEELACNALSKDEKNKLILKIAALEMKNALESFTTAASANKKLLVTRAYKECAEDFLDQIKENLKDSFSPNCQLYKELTLYKSSSEAKQQLKMIGEAWRRSHTKGGDDPSKPLYDCKRPGTETIADILINFYPMTVTTSSRYGTKSLYYYDYNLGLFTANEDLLAEMVVNLTGEITQSLLNSVRLTLKSRSEELYPYVAPPSYLIKVKNGIFNLITKKFEPEDEIFWTFMTSINCNYVPKKMIPQSVHKGYTFDRLVNDLANNNKKRAKLLKQICKSLMTGVLPSPAIFIVCGQGGDGKSLFFDLMQEIIGVDNTAQVNFSMLNQPDKVLGMVGAKFTYGTDNTNGAYISDTGLLKAVATQNRWAFSRKYYEALFAWINTIMVQLCNEMPRMSETGIQMQRRLVAFKAENSHAIKGTADNTLPYLLRSEEFKEYILSEILDEEKVPYYSDFNDVDRSLVNDNLNSEDTIRQYLQYIWSVGTFDDESTVIPLKLLYSGYVAWCKNNLIDSIVSVRSFHARSQIYFEKLGFAKSKDTRRIKSLIADYGELSASFGELVNNTDLQDDYLSNSPSSYYYRDIEIEPNPSVLDFEYRRKDLECTRYEYYGVADNINHALDTSDKYGGAHLFDIAMYIRDYGKDKTVLELFDEERDKTYIDLDIKLKEANPDYTSYYDYYLKPRLDAYNREALQQLNNYLGYNDEFLDAKVEKLVNMKSSPVNDGIIDTDKLLNQIALKNNKNKKSKFLIGMSKAPSDTNLDVRNLKALLNHANAVKMQEHAKFVHKKAVAEDSVTNALLDMSEYYMPELTAKRDKKSPSHLFIKAFEDVLYRHDYTKLTCIREYMVKSKEVRNKLEKANKGQVTNITPILTLDKTVEYICQSISKYATYMTNKYSDTLNEVELHELDEFKNITVNVGDAKQRELRIDNALTLMETILKKYFK